MKKIVLLSCSLFIASFFAVFSQTSTPFGINIELGISAKMAKGSDTAGRHIFITPSYALNEQLNVGIGAGRVTLVDEFFTKKDMKFVKYIENTHLYPVYANALYKINTKKFYPFVQTKVGYSFAHKKHAGQYQDIIPNHNGKVDFHSVLKGGVFFSPGIGMGYCLNNDHRIFVSLSYMFQQLSIDKQWITIDPKDEKFDKSEKFKSNNHFLMFNIGYSFR